MPGKSLISEIALEESVCALATPLIQRDRNAALRDLQKVGHFQPLKDDAPPYHVSLGLEQRRLVFRITNSHGKILPILALSLSPYRRLIKDYFIIMHSHEEAVRDGKPSRIEAIDMGRRALHNEAATLLMERLSDKIALDLATARHIFTLICALHEGATLWRA